MTKSILVIDDDNSIRSIIDIGLNLSNKYEVMMAASGKEGLEKASKQRPDLILLDVMMPDMDGFEVIDNLRQNEKTKDVLIVVMTAKRKQEIIAKVNQYGIKDIISKPFTIMELPNMLEKAFDKETLSNQNAQLPPELLKLKQRHYAVLDINIANLIHAINTIYKDDNPILVKSASRLAHKLVGELGLFDYTRAAEISSEIEQLLQQDFNKHKKELINKSKELQREWEND